jgi:hypothetical protein
MVIGGWRVGRKNDMKQTVSEADIVHTNLLLLFQEELIAQLPIHLKLVNSGDDNRTARKACKRLECTQIGNSELLSN